MGGRNLPGHNTFLCQQRRILRAISSDLWDRWDTAVVSPAQILSKTHPDLFSVRSGLLRAGVCRQRFPGMEMGTALVGLQRLFFESQRPHLPAERRLLRAGRYAAQLLSSAILHAAVPPDSADMAADSLRHPPDRLHSGYHLLRSQTPYGAGYRLS